jgi:TRIAD3 protein (E3 ubiquitin-protein ligase RNF216)
VDDINIKLCQHCGAGTDIGENVDHYLLVCMECFKDTCLKCNQVDHPGKACYSLGNITQSKRQEIEDKMTEALIVKCNHCNRSIFKNEGCNKITCVCGTHNCYICKQIIPKSVGYSHFCIRHNCDCNKCHLWEQNTKKRLLDAVKEDYDDETKKLITGLL